MRKLALIALLMIAVVGFTQETSEKPAPAKMVVDTAIAKAAKENKSVFVIFHASWCGWCKQLDKWMATPEAKAFFDKEFVVVHLTVEERGEKEVLNNPGGMDYKTQWHGAKAGLPFSAMLDSKGKMVINSNSKNDGKEGNIGCPWAPEEQDWFFGMVSKTRPSVSKDALAALRANLVSYVKANGG
jgi:hypothetical protein